MVLTVEDFGVPSTEYVVNEGVFNGTGEIWIGYEIVLGFGTGGSFVQSSLGDGLSFDNPDYNSPLDLSPFTIMTPFNEDVINGVSAFVPSRSFNTWIFSIDVPNTITEFTIRQVPRTAPVPVEPATGGRVKTLYDR